MAILKRIKTLFSKRSGGINDPNMWINTALQTSGYASKSGAVITADTALKISTVYACVTKFSHTIASLPMTINKTLPQGGNEVVSDHYLYPILHDNFNYEQTSFEAREMGIGHLKLRGNWYNFLQRNGAGQTVGIWPLNPSYMEVVRVGNGIWYRYTHPDTHKQYIYSAAEIWHVKGFSKDGLVGMSTVEYARESMGMAQSLQDFAATFFGNKAVPGAVLRHPGQLGDVARKNLSESMDEYATTKRHTTLVLEEGMEWQSVGISNSDAQFLETTNAQVRDIARWFHMPLILLQEPDKASTYASVEQFMLSFVQHTIAPDVVRIEQSANRALLTEADRQNGYYIKLNLKGLLRGDFATRMNGYRVAREGGWMCVDDIRGLEDMSPLPDGKGQIYLQPLNYKEAGTETPAPAAAPFPEKDEKTPQEKDDGEEGNQDV